MPEVEAVHDVALVRDFAIIMAVAGVSIVLFRRLNMPPILGYLLAGLIVGPFTFPLMGLDAPVSDADGIRRLADLGLILLLFALGLEFGWQRIRQMGLQLILLGAIEISFMIAVGYQIGTLLGWTGTESIFLGAALSISSSAILVKMLRDTGTLFSEHGRLIIGILVVEDFAAVLLLSVLSGVATTGTAEVGDVGLLIGKLVLFLISSLAIGALVAPRLINFVHRFRSSEALLVVSMAMCFGVALIAEGLGISAAAGAFIIGTILGDTHHSEELAHTMNPVRDIFAALFFVSIGMLIDLSLVADFIVPALIVSVVFVSGKVFIDTCATFLVGYSGRTSLSVGMGMPQIGEFSLAMVKVGADHNAVSTFLYPVVAVATAITSLVYPFIFRSANATASFLATRSPTLLKDYFETLSFWLTTVRSLFSLQGELYTNIRHSFMGIMVNVSIVVVLVVLGTAILPYASALADWASVTESVAGLIISGLVITLSIPSAIFIWRSLQHMIDQVSEAIIRTELDSVRIGRLGSLRQILRDSVLLALITLLIVLSLPLLSQLLALGSFSAPVPILVLIAVVAVAWRMVFRIHEVLEETFSRTFLGDQAGAFEEDRGESD